MAAPGLGSGTSTLQFLFDSDQYQGVLMSMVKHSSRSMRAAPSLGRGNNGCPAPPVQ